MKKIVLLNVGLFFFAAINAQQTPEIKVARAITAEKKADSVRQLLIKKDTVIKKSPTKKPYKEAAKKTAAKTEAKRND